VLGSVQLSGLLEEQLKKIYVLEMGALQLVTPTVVEKVHLLVSCLKGIWLPLETQQVHGFTGTHPSRHLISFFVHFQGHKQMFHLYNSLSKLFEKFTRYKEL
jgi:hypothetical protein